jgi:glucokinase
VLIADIGGTNCRFELWKIDMTGGRAHQELYHQVHHSGLLLLHLEARLNIFLLLFAIS